MPPDTVSITAIVQVLTEADMDNLSNLAQVFYLARGVGGTVACESALRSGRTLLSRVRAPPPAFRPDGGP
ncbi:hypothetical protein PoB_006532400 [Plakobranchus ocellatus]|uniref:Uncharacterized protein n=1 Tax=Plakobranchus ocellatus TaxID=259542 RepID=A0AAV4D3U7_9GAST|nr:hypothetical protein PoB_006532400 [Plakobranchus ocellatus]